jgi:hypothetical protein
VACLSSKCAPTGDANQRAKLIAQHVLYQASGTGIIFEMMAATIPDYDGMEKSG